MSDCLVLVGLLVPIASHLLSEQSVVDLFSVRHDSQPINLEFFLSSLLRLLLLLLLLVALLNVLFRYADESIILLHSRVHGVVVDSFVLRDFIH